MKDYNTVVQDRYNTESAKSIYAADQPIGKYSRNGIYSVIGKILNNYTEKHGTLSEKQLLDVGCGTGEMIEHFIKEGFSPENSTGIDLSENRIGKANQLNTGATFICDNGLTFQLGKQFDVITSFDMFSHIIEERDIIGGLANIRDHLSKNGIFIWYDIYNDDHYNAPANTDSWGFSRQQMEDLAAKAGLKKHSHSTTFKRFFGKYHSLYQAARIPHPVLRFLEKVLPGKPGNVVLVLTKD